MRSVPAFCTSAHALDIARSAPLGSIRAAHSRPGSSFRSAHASSRSPIEGKQNIILSQTSSGMCANTSRALFFKWCYSFRGRSTGGGARAGHTPPSLDNSGSGKILKERKGNPYDFRLSAVVLPQWFYGGGANVHQHPAGKPSNAPARSKMERKMSEKYFLSTIIEHPSAVLDGA